MPFQCINLWCISVMFGFFRPPPPKTGAGRPVSHPSSNPHPTCFISSPRVGQVLESRLFMPCHHLSFFPIRMDHTGNIWKHESMNPRPSLPTLAPLAPVVALEVGHWRHSGFTCGFSWGDRPFILYVLCCLNVHSFCLVRRWDLKVSPAPWPKVHLPDLPQKCRDRQLVCVWG